jgi:hypothetical protein
MGLYDQEGTTTRAASSNAPAWEQPPAWLRPGIPVYRLGGAEDLDVVGESYYQDNLWRLVDSWPRQERVRKEILAVLAAEDNNPHDPEAISVWIRTLKVGHLSRENAHRYRPGLLAQQQAHGQPIALSGVIVGGGIRADGLGKLGVFLSHNPADFGFLRRPLPPPPEPAVRTGLSDVLAAGDSYELAWMSDFPSDPIRAVPWLRELLAHEQNVLDRHFMHAELEAILYRARNAFASALSEYDEACRQHDAEMDAIRQACLSRWGHIPVLDTYKQMAIRQQKAHDYQQALWWAERGLAIYAGNCTRPEAAQDLRDRAANYRAKLA